LINAASRDVAATEGSGVSSDSACAAEAKPTTTAMTTAATGTVALPFGDGGRRPRRSVALQAESAAWGHAAYNGQAGGFA